jgi:hypothetical protein
MELARSADDASDDTSTSFCRNSSTHEEHRLLEVTKTSPFFSCHYLPGDSGLLPDPDLEPHVLPSSRPFAAGCLCYICARLTPSLMQASPHPQAPCLNRLNTAGDSSPPPLSGPAVTLTLKSSARWRQRPILSVPRGSTILPALFLSSQLSRRHISVSSASLVTTPPRCSATMMPSSRARDGKSSCLNPSSMALFCTGGFRVCVRVSKMEVCL